MKRYLFILILLTGTAYGQQSKDTLCFPTETVRGLLISAEQGKLLKQRIPLLEERIKEKDIVIKALNDKDSTSKVKYDAEIVLLNKDKKDLQDANKKLKRRHTRERIGAGLVSAGLIYLSLRK